MRGTLPLQGEGSGTPLQGSRLDSPMDGGAWWAAVHGVAKSQTRLSDFPFPFHFHALEKEMATHSRVLAWRIPGTGEPGGLPSGGSRRVGHDWATWRQRRCPYSLKGRRVNRRRRQVGPWEADGVRTWRRKVVRKLKMPGLEEERNTHWPFDDRERGHQWAVRERRSEPPVTLGSRLVAFRETGCEAVRPLGSDGGLRAWSERWGCERGPSFWRCLCRVDNSGGPADIICSRRWLFAGCLDSYSAKASRPVQEWGRWLVRI